MSNPDGRSAILHRLGYSSYAKYLKSPLWKSIKQRVYAKYGASCQLCGMSIGVTLHHQSYTEANLSGRSLKDLHPICHRCHDEIHIDPDTRKKLPLSEVRKRFIAAVRVAAKIPF